jgi:hypothetical protein
MSQYHLVANLTREEYLDPTACGDGVKLCEFITSSEGTLMALAALLAQSNSGGEADIHSTDPLIGAWAGDQITIVGDQDRTAVYSYQHIKATFANISDQIMQALRADPSLFAQSDQQEMAQEPPTDLVP